VIATTSPQTTFTTLFSNLYSHNRHNLVSQHALRQLHDTLAQHVVKQILQHTCTTCTHTTLTTHLHNMCIEVHLLTAYKHINTFDEHTCTTCTRTSFTTHSHNMYSNNVHNLVSTTCTHTTFTTHLHNMYSNKFYNTLPQHVLKQLS
jgi:hypothetical protein